MRFAVFLTLTTLAAWPVAAAAPAAERPLVVELFTSQGCSSCPPADAFLHELAARRADLLPLAFHVTYWNNLGWADPYATETGTARQRHYAQILADKEVYTPEMVIDGRLAVVGSDRAAAEQAFASLDRMHVAPLTLAATGAEVTVEIGAGQGRGTVWLAGYDPEHVTAVGRGENGGRSLLEANIVRSFTAIGQWTGAALTLKPVRPAGDRLAVILQADDGRILTAARTMN